MPKKALLKKLRNKCLKTGDRHHLPLPTGPYKKIGCRDFMCGLSRKGGVLLRLFYPAKVEEQNDEINPLLWPNWLPHDNYRQGFADVAGIRSKFLMNIIQRTNKENVFIPVIPKCKPLSLSGAKFPVVVFSHGLGACRTTYSSICTELASHGFVVAAVEHRDNSACLSFYAKRSRYSFKNSNPNFFDEVDAKTGEDEVDFGDEIDDPNYVPPKALSALTNIPNLELAWVRHRRIPITKTSTAICTFRNKQIFHRVRECSRALDLVEALNAGYEINNLLDPAYNISEFENMLDLDKIIIMGHSMGGATALMSAAAELRFKVAIALDAWMYPIKNESLELISQPVLLINTETMTTHEPNRAKMSEVMSQIEGDDPERRKAITINGSKHLQQSDAPYVFGWFALLLSGNIFKKSINSLTVHDLTSYLSLQFISKFLDIEINSKVNKYVEEQKKLLRPTFP